MKGSIVQDGELPCVEIRHDLIDCHIDICSPEVCTRGVASRIA
jgi:hypothetical protein